MKAISLPLLPAGGVKVVSIPAPDLPPFELGDVIVSGVAGQVIQSRSHQVQR